MSECINPQVGKTFRPEGRGFISYTDGLSGTLPSPLWTIARIAQHRVTAGAELDLSHIAPSAYEDQVLKGFEERYGSTGVDVHVSSVRALGVAKIGRQILALNEQGAIQPPLQDSEMQTISHLVNTVDQAIAH